MGTALAFGGLHTITVVIAAPAVFAAALLTLRGQSLSAVPVPARLLFGLALYTLIQAAPLPTALVRVLSPQAAEIWEGAWGVTRSGASGFMSLSVDRGASVMEALKWAMYGAAFVTAARYGVMRSMARGLMLPFVSALVIAVVTLVHALARAKWVYGLYEPTFGPSIWHIGPLLNPNHLASYLNLGLFCGLGLLVAKRQFLPRWALGLGVAFLLPNAIVAGSRGGIAGLAVGLVCFFVFLPRRRSADPDFGPVPRLALLATLASVFVVGAGLTVVLASENTARELYETNINKLRLLTWAAQLIRDFPAFGVGRGAFEGVFASYRTGMNNEIATHPENLVAQWLGEWGIIVGIAALVAFIWMFRPRELGTKWSAVASGAVAGVGAMVVQNFADFGLEVPAIALATIVALGVCWGHNAGRRSNGDVAEEGAWRPWHFAFLAAGLCLVALPLVLGARLLPLERLALVARYRSLDERERPDLKELRSKTAAAVEAHPAEPYFYRLGALLTWRTGGDPMPWLQRALDRGPSVGRSHLMVARVLASRRAVRQALMELRLATTYDPALAPITARAAASWTRDYAMLGRAVPAGQDGVKMLLALARELPASADARPRVLEEAVLRQPKRRETSLLLAQEAVRQLELPVADHERCSGEARAACLAEAERWLRQLESLAANDIDVVLLRTRMLRANGHADQALQLLAERCPNMSGRGRSLCLKQRLELAGRSQLEPGFAVAARDYLADNCTDSEGCSMALEKVADMSAARGDHEGALPLYERAARERSDDRLWMKLARTAFKVGAHQRVITALDRVRARAQFEPEYSRLLKRAQRGGLVGN